MAAAGNLNFKIIRKVLSAYHSNVNPSQKRARKRNNEM